MPTATLGPDIKAQGPMSHQPQSVREHESFLRSLLESQDMLALAQTTVRHMHSLGCQWAQLAWNTELGQDNMGQAYPSGPVDDNVASLLSRARHQDGLVEQASLDGHCTAGAILLSRNGHLWATLAYRRERDAMPQRQAEWQEALNLMSLRCESMLQTEGLRLDVERLARAERLHRALFAISDCASSDRETADVLHELHQIVGQLMYAKNFFIVRYTAEPESMRFIYFADSQDVNVRDPNEVVDAARISNSLTLAMLRKGLPMHGPGNLLREKLKLVRDDVVGPKSEDWLGVPMIENGKVRGAVVVQSYDPAVRYSYDDQTLLAYLAQNILTALARREAAEEMERRVAERTIALRQEITERQRSERLQAALFRIAEVANSGETMEAFYASIHSIVGGLLDARNFYIALLTEDDDALEFPFSVDENHARFESRRLGRGLSEYVLRTGKPQLIDLARFTELIAAGEVQRIGAKAVSWLGVPLMIEGKTIGLVAVQTYTSESQFTVRDEELLNFVSFHIANAVERRRASESLHIANLQLEHASQTDPLTGLHNRRYLTSQIPVDLALFDREHARSADSGHALVFALVDIDHFKRINDTYGHSAGDRALQLFAQVLTGLVQAGDCVVRWGGEEFLLVFRPMSRQSVPGLGERIRHKVAEYVFDSGDGVRLPLTCSIGLAEYPLFRDGQQPLGWEQTVELADAALYWVKNNGRDGWATLRPTEYSDRASLLDSLQSGAQALIDNRQLKIISSRDTVMA
jgi:diguanylate cyclase (GGDEF)-like protein